MPKIFVVGSFVVGMTIKVPRFPHLGESLVGHSFDLGPGGKGSNQAIAAARLGADVQLMACIGADLFATIATDLWEREGLDQTHIHQIPEATTGAGFISVLPNGENWIVVDPGANLHMTTEHVEAAADLIAGSDVVMAQLEVPEAPVARALELGRQSGATTILNPAPARPLAATTLALVDILTPNETETRILLDLPPDDPTPTPELARRLLGLGVERIVITRGEHGALIVTPAGMEEIPSASVQAVDVTGAGDSFNAALAVGLAEGLDFPLAVQQACYAGAYTTTHLGVVPGLPTRHQLDEFVAGVLT